MINSILIITDSIDINDSSGSKANVALIQNLGIAGFEVEVMHYTRRNIQLAGVKTVSIPEIKYSLLYFLSRFQRVFQRNTKYNPAPFLERIFGFSFTFLNDTASMAQFIRRSKINADLIITLSKGGSFRPHYAVLNCPALHSRWMAYMHDPYPFHYYPRPYNWVEASYRAKENFVIRVSEKARYSGFPSKLLMEWMGSYFPQFLNTGVIIPHQNIGSTKDVELPGWFDRSKFNLLHAGNLMKQRPPHWLIEGYERFLDNNIQARNECCLMLIGPASYHRAFLQSKSDNGTALFIYDGTMDFDLIYLLQQQVTINIILESNSEISPFLPGKFPHCVAANKLILLLSPYYSETRRLLGADYSYWAESNDVDQIAVLIEKMYEAWKTDKNTLLLNRPDLADYCSPDYLKTIIEKIGSDD